MTSVPSDPAAPPERSLNRQTILEEDEYTEALSHIIARDFFPSLIHLDATNEYLDALRTRDPHLINASVRQLQEVAATPVPSTTRLRIPTQTPTRTPFGYAAETPLRSETGEPQQKKPRYDTNMSLDDFQARYTSEDNSSFTQILDQENKVRTEKYGWAWEAQRKVEMQRDRMIEQRKQALIQAPAPTGVRGKFTIEAPTPAGLLTDGKEKKEDAEDVGKEESKLALVTTEGNPGEDIMAPQKHTRPAGVDGWNFKARNTLMFAPDADVSPYHPPTTTVDVPKNLKTVAYANTRLKEQEHDVGDRPLSAPPSPTRSRINAAITGTDYPPNENGFALVPNLPSPTPAELGPTAMKQLMTWGTLNATPRIISQTGDPAEPSTPFRIPEMTSREAIAHKLSNKAAKSLRVKADMFTPRPGKATALGKKGSMAPPSWTPRRSDAVGNLTPAARRLLERTTMGTAAARRSDSVDNWDSGGKGKDLDRIRWTPTPSESRR